MWKTSPPRPSETPDPGFRKGGTHPSGLKYNWDVLRSRYSFKLEFHSKRILSPFINTLYRIHEGCRFGLCMRPVSQFILIEEAFSFQLEKNRLLRH